MDKDFKRHAMSNHTTKKSKGKSAFQKMSDGLKKQLEKSMPESHSTHYNKGKKK